MTGCLIESFLDEEQPASNTRQSSNKVIKGMLFFDLNIFLPPRLLI
ncbi:hypothetical protein DCCM_0992 [Desulfocucumis palustris]|uniref:Uncharacterized protein n=1 Tax=Desulfocucumis palustris TaxID=1898651 RepID=A0A2L2XEY3_9FIRM|nr:hypothetical protein DCCM_0992 [Desulfocucumis palustris]